MSRIKSAFERLNGEGRKALIPFITAGDPDAALTLPLMHTLVEAGADVIELGVPFSDPMADGPTIQRASERALAKGMTLRKVLGLVVDYPPEEAATFGAAIKAHGMDPIFLLVPTSTAARIEQVAEIASGYVYYVSLAGVTGSGALNVDAVAERLPLIREKTGLPVGVGFGIRDAATAARIARIADAVVVGSRIIEEIEKSTAEAACGKVKALVAEIRRGVDEVKK